MKHRSLGDPESEWRHLHQRLFVAFDYESAEDLAVEAISSLVQRDVQDPAVRELAFQAHSTLAVVQRDRGNPRSETSFQTALSIALQQRDLEGVASVADGLITARVIRGELAAAEGALLSLIGSHPATPRWEYSIVSQQARLAEERGALAVALKLGKGAENSAPSTREYASQLIMRARRLARRALNRSPGERLRALDAAWSLLVEADDELTRSRQDIFEVLCLATKAAIQLAAEDVEDASSTLKAAERLVRRIGIRNRWVESVAAQLMSMEPISPPSQLETAVIRAHTRETHDPKDAYRELALGLEHFLRLAVRLEPDGTLATAVGKQMYGTRLREQAFTHLRAAGIPIDLAVSETELRKLFEWRDEASHAQAKRPSSIEWRDHLHKLRYAIRRIETLLPEDLLAATTGDLVDIWRRA